MSTLDLEGLKELLEKATTGPWFADANQPRLICAPDDDHIPWTVAETASDCGWEEDRAEPNAALIVALRNAAPDLIARIRELEAAAKTVVSMRVGERPSRGWLPDNDETRTALQNLADVLLQQPVEGDKP